MKYSTYMMLAAFFAGLIAVIILILTVIASGEPWNDSTIQLKGKQVDVTMPQFKNLDISISLRGKNFRLENFRGIEILESDSVDSPVMTLSESIKAMTETRLVNDTMYLSVNPALVCDTINPKHTMFFETTDIHPVTITIPSGMLRSVNNNSDAVYLNGINTRRLDTSVKKGRVVMNRCSVDSLVSDSRNISEIKLTDSKISVIQLNNAPKEAVVKCTDATSAISKLSVTAKKADTGCVLSLKKATVGEIEWNPYDSTTVLTLQLAKPVTVTTGSGK